MTFSLEKNSRLPFLTPKNDRALQVLQLISLANVNKTWAATVGIFTAWIKLNYARTVTRFSICTFRPLIMVDALKPLLVCQGENDGGKRFFHLPVPAL